MPETMTGLMLESVTSFKLASVSLVNIDTGRHAPRFFQLF